MKTGCGIKTGDQKIAINAEDLIATIREAAAKTDDGGLTMIELSDAMNRSEHAVRRYMHKFELSGGKIAIGWRSITTRTGLSGRVPVYMFQKEEAQSNTTVNQT